MQLIEQQIKALFKTKGAFAEHIVVNPKDLSSKFKGVQNRINAINKFLAPLELHVEITSNKSVGKENKGISTNDGKPT